MNAKSPFNKQFSLEVDYVKLDQGDLVVSFTF